MTKLVRIENADNSNFKVVVQVWDRMGNGVPDRMDREIVLTHPCQMTDHSVFITSSRYLIIREAS